MSFTFDLHSAVVSDSHLPCRAHAILLKATAQHGRRDTACGLPARFRLLPATTRICTKVVIRNIPISDGGCQCETRQRLSLTRKSGSSTLQNRRSVNPLNPELNPICYLLALLAHHFLHLSRIRVKSLTLRLLMLYIYMAHLFLMFLDHTQRRSTVGRTPLDE